MTKGRRQNNVIDGMHADMLVIAVLTFAQSLVGAPWLVAATVRSLSHVAALAKYNQKGEVTKTLEQRLTGMSIHALIASCVLLTAPRELLANLPKAVFMGLFLFLGISSVRGNEMWERITDTFRDAELKPERRWTSKVPQRVVNSFTFVQMIALAAMIWLKESRFGVLFPIVIAGLAPLKVCLERWVFKKEYVALLDEE